MRISEVAQHVGIKATTIRFYESVGVLPPAHRVKGHRVYGADTLDRLTLIRFGLRTGFTLKELKDLFVRFNSRSTRRNTAQRKLRELRALRDRIQLTEKLLKQVELCHCGTLREITERLQKSGALDQLSSRTLKRGSKKHTTLNLDATQGQ